MLPARATLLLLLTLVPALGQTITVDLAAPSGIDVMKTVYGYGQTGDQGTANHSFDWTDRGFAAALKELQPPLVRQNWDGDGKQMSALFPTRASAPDHPTLKNSIRSWLDNPRMFDPRTLFIVNFGGHPAWLDIGRAADRALLGQMYVTVYRLFRKAGIDVHYWEPWNERTDYDPAEMGKALTAIQAALRAVDPEAKVGGLADIYFDPPNPPGRTAIFLANAHPDFLSWHNYPTDGTDCTPSPCPPARIFASGLAEAQSATDAARVLAEAGQTGTPIFLGEYNICSCFEPSDPRQQRGMGAAFAIYYLTSGLKTNTNVRFGALWDIHNDDYFGAIQSKGGSFRIGPQGIALRHAARVMPGTSVGARQDGLTNVDVFATVNGSSYALQIVNFDPYATPTVSIAGLPGTSVEHFEVDDAHLGGRARTLGQAQLAAVTLPAMSVTWISGKIPAATGGD